MKHYTDLNNKTLKKVGKIFEKVVDFLYDV